ncbi:MAG: MFS transporter [Steroidobacteraceae bacterium]
MEKGSFYGWKLIAAFWVIVFINIAFAAYGSPVMNAGMAQKLHLSRTLAGLPYSVYTVMSAVPSVLIAVLVSRFGVRLTVVFGSLLILAGCVLMATVVNSALGAVIVFGFVIAFGVCAGGVFGIQPGVVLWFERRRALAISLVYSGGAFGGLFAARVLNRVIVDAGGNWRAGWWLFAALAAVATVIAAVFIRERPSDLGQEPDGGPRPVHSTGAAGGARRRSFITHEVWPFGEVLRSGRFWIMVLALCGGSAGFTLFMAQGVLHLNDLGFTTAQAAVAVSVTTGSALLGKAALALFGDVVDPRYIWAVTAAVFGIGLVLVIDPRSMHSVYLFSLCVGFGFGGGLVCMMTTLSNYYGTAVFAAAAGIAGALNTIISFVASVLGGVVYDAVGSYAPTFYILSAWCFAGAIALVLVRPPLRHAAAGRPAVAVSGGP